MNGRRRLVFAAAVLGLAVLACNKPPDPAAIHREKGDELFEKGQWKAAAAEYALSLEADPKQDKIWERKAFAHLKDNDRAEAVASLLKTGEHMTEAKDKAELYRKIAGIYVEYGPVEMAEKYFLEALKVDPKDEASLAWLGEIFSQLGGARKTEAVAVPAQLQKAIGYYDQAIAINPNAQIPYVNKRIALIKLANYEKKEKEVAEKEAQSPSLRKDHAKVAELKAKAEQHQARFDDYKRQSDELGAKISEMIKASKAKSAAASK
jgi:tetratricopeptide (TPR) repeat protein